MELKIQGGQWTTFFGVIAFVLVPLGVLAASVPLELAALFFIIVAALNSKIVVSNVPVAQMEEHQNPNLEAVGSSPTRDANSRVGPDSYLNAVDGIR